MTAREGLGESGVGQGKVLFYVTSISVCVCVDVVVVVIFQYLSKHPEKAMAPHSSTLAWKIPWMEEAGRLQSMGSLRVGHN